MKSLIQIHIAVFLFGIAGLFGKVINQSPIIIVFGRVLFASLALSLFVLFSRSNFKLKNNLDLYVFILSGIMLAIHWITFFYSIQISTVAIGLITFSTFPVFVALLEPLVFKNKVSKNNFFVSLFALVGVVLIVPEFSFKNNLSCGIMWGIISGLIFAFISILNKKYVQKYSGVVVALYQDVFAAISLLPFVLMINSSFGKNEFLYLMVLGVFCTALAHALFIYGLKNIKAFTASIITMLEPVYGIVFACFILNEMPGLKTILGGVIILLSVFFVTRIDKRIL